MIFQDPFSSLNPRMTIAEIIGEPLLVNGMTDTRARNATGRRTADLVHLPAAYLNRFPHAFSGGQRQRIGIARALALSPSLIVADEPVSALDVSVQAQIVNLMLELQDRLGIAYLFVAHDLSVVKHVSHRVAVMYIGRIVEIAPTGALFASPRHPYTEALLSAVPVPDPRQRAQRIVLEGDVADPSDPPSGCPFHPRCRYVTEQCRQVTPALQEVAPGHWVRCLRASELALSRCRPNQLPQQRQIGCNIPGPRYSAGTMQLTMTVLRCPDSVAPETRSVSGGDFSVGRGPGVDWILPDPERLLSKRHFAVAFRGGIWQLADTSTNGTFLNRESEPIGASDIRSLRDGDRLRLGPYEIEVRLVEDAIARPGADRSSPFADPFAMDPFAPAPAQRNPFDEPDHPSLRLRPSSAQLPPDFDPLTPEPREVAVPRSDPGGSFAGTAGCISAAAGGGADTVAFRRRDPGRRSSPR